MSETHNRERAWRIGRTVPLNVYFGDRPVCQCHSEADARRIVRGMNAERGPAPAEATWSADGAQLNVNLSRQAIEGLNQLAQRGIYGRDPSEVAARFIDAELQKHVTFPTIDLKNGAA